MSKLLFVALVCVVLSGCAAGSNPFKDTPKDSSEKPAGFFLGLWHGMIILITFIVSLFKSSVGIYEVHNTGFGYNFGFLLGILIIYGGGSGTAARSR
jgi:hypothetical protein